MEERRLSPKGEERHRVGRNRRVRRGGRARGDGRKRRRDEKGDGFGTSRCIMLSRAHPGVRSTEEPSTDEPSASLTPEATLWLHHDSSRRAARSPMFVLTIGTARGPKANASARWWHILTGMMGLSGVAEGSTASVGAARKGWVRRETGEESRGREEKGFRRRARRPRENKRFQSY